MEHMPIPEIRGRLHALARRMRSSGLRHWAKELDNLADAATRRSPVKVGRVKSRRMTGARARSIRAYAAENPDKNLDEIGAAFGVNPGRVSEALRGKNK